jgi:GrpB-like predicted nucleotidyltransferase (UPF0157 family)
MPQAPIIVLPYDAAWPARFEAERTLIDKQIAAYVVGAIEHVGSTAVPQLAAKPVIDIMVGVESLEASRAALPLLESLSYCYFPYKPDVMHWLCKPSDEIRTHHLHLVPFGSALWIERLAFRDYLRAHPQARADYARLKQDLAERHRNDREAYTEQKGDFIKMILARALH